MAYKNMKEWRKANPEKFKQHYINLKNRKGKDYFRDNALQKNYGITLDDYYQMLSAQNNVCAICNRVCKTGKFLAVDHCHETNKIRGLLCAACNMALGNFEDSCDFLEKAIKYLRGELNVVSFAK